MQIGGFRPTTSLAASWFGRVALGAPGESWPTTDGKPMLALCQINLTELPFRPPRLDDVEMLAVFIGPDRLPSDAANGQGWCLRAHRDISSLEPLVAPETRSPIKAFPMQPREIDEDMPCWDDARDVPDELWDDYHDLFETADGFKLGGWPRLIQSEIFWAPWNKHPAQPEYVFQIDSTEKGHWSWGDGGVGYFGRGTAEGHRDVWTLEWQCY